MDVFYDLLGSQWGVLGKTTSVIFFKNLVGDTDADLSVMFTSYADQTNFLERQRFSDLELVKF